MLAKDWNQFLPPPPLHTSGDLSGCSPDAPRGQRPGAWPAPPPRYHSPAFDSPSLSQKWSRTCQEAHPPFPLLVQSPGWQARYIHCVVQGWILDSQSHHLPPKKLLWLLRPLRSKCLYKTLAPSYLSEKDVNCEIDDEYSTSVMPER